MTLLTNLMAWYDLDGDLTDASGNSRDLSELSTVSYGTGLIGQAATDGLASNTVWASGIDWSVTPFTLVMWLKASNPGDVGNGCGFALQFYTGLEWKTAGSINTYFGGSDFTLYVTKGDGAQTNVATIPLDDAWHMVAMTSAGDVYVNSALAGTVTGTIASYSNDSDVIALAADEVPVAIDLCGVWSRVLSADEIGGLYSGGVGRDYAGIVAAASATPPPAQQFQRRERLTDPIFSE